MTCGSRGIGHSSLHHPLSLRLLVTQDIEEQLLVVAAGVTDDPLLQALVVMALEGGLDLRELLVAAADQDANEGLAGR